MPPVRRLIDHVRGWHPDLEPVVELLVHRRVVGEWEPVPRRDPDEADR